MEDSMQHWCCSYNVASSVTSAYVMLVLSRRLISLEIPNCAYTHLSGPRLSILKSHKSSNVGRCLGRLTRLVSGNLCKDSVMLFAIDITAVAAVASVSCCEIL